MPLRGKVGRDSHNGGRQCQNWIDDQQTVTALLNHIPVADGGSGGSLHGRIVAGLASNDLCKAIEVFEDKYFPGQRSGSVDPGGRMLKQMEEAFAKTIPAPTANPNGPPPKNSTPTPERIKALDNWLLSITEGHPLSKEPWTFYDELEAYAGPFGKHGYPIAYGKKYCMLFNGDKKLAQDPQGKAWVHKTTILLQTFLRNFVVDRYAKGTLPSLTEQEMRDAAFDSHPMAYTKGGLALVVLISPGLLPTIASMPAIEFINENSWSSVVQFYKTDMLIEPEMIKTLLTSLAMPAHLGAFSRAMAQDQERLQYRIRLGAFLDGTKTAVQAGKLDRIAWLEQITIRFNQTEFPSRDLSDFAGTVVLAAEARKHTLAARYRADIKKAPDLKETYDSYDPGWSRW